MVITLHLFVLYGCQNKQQLCVLYVTNRFVFVTEVESVYSAVRTESLI